MLSVPAMAKPVQKNCTHLTASNLIKQVTDCLGEITDHRPNHYKNGITFGNFAKPAFAMIQMKIPSMLRFDNEWEAPHLGSQSGNLVCCYQWQGSL